MSVFCVEAMDLTTRASAGFLRAVLGVFPRSFPGVLKASANFLLTISTSSTIENGSWCRECGVRLVLVKDTVHVLVEPIQLVSCGIRELLKLILCYLKRIRTLICDPRARTNLETRSSHRHGERSSVKVEDVAGSRLRYPKVDWSQRLTIMKTSVSS